ncbi:hypothetical protein OROHE_008472 [Orobanche hederae]
MEMDQKYCLLKVEKFIENHAWTASEKLLRRPGSDYDFRCRNPHKTKEDFEKLQAAHSGCDIIEGRHV